MIQSRPACQKGACDRKGISLWPYRAAYFCSEHAEQERQRLANVWGIDLEEARRRA